MMILVAAIQTQVVVDAGSGGNGELQLGAQPVLVVGSGVGYVEPQQVAGEGSGNGLFQIFAPATLSPDTADNIMTTSSREHSDVSPIWETNMASGSGCD
jgi:hypothetical protein